MPESMGFSTGIEVAEPVAARVLLAEGLPDEPRHGLVAQAGLLKTFRPAARLAA